jgi:hypothetical protein
MKTYLLTVLAVGLLIGPDTPEDDVKKEKNRLQAPRAMTRTGQLLPISPRLGMAKVVTLLVVAGATVDRQ